MARSFQKNRKSRNMTSFTTICCLLIGAHFAIFANAQMDSSELNEIGDGTTNDFTDDVTEQQDNRWELESMSWVPGLKMANNAGEMVELTKDDSSPQGWGSRTFGQSVNFLLYTRKNRRTHQSLLSDPTVGHLERTNFNVSLPTVFITHGWIGSADSLSCTLIRDAFLKKRDINVIVVDWSAISFSFYPWAAKQVRYVGREVAQMINYLRVRAGMDLGKTILVGHSLGAHVMGIAGYLAEDQVKYIVGLDPAFPMFRFARPGWRISRHDAEHVEIIHTNAGILGFWQPIGHVDFYPNGGSKQPGCDADFLFACSHTRAVEIFAETINSKIGFYGKRCDSDGAFLYHSCNNDYVVQMGATAPGSDTQGIFYLWTNSKKPFARGPQD